MANNVDLSGLIKKLDQAAGLKKEVMRKAYKAYKDLTPINKGYAKRHTVLKNDEIRADYPYAGVLDGGRRVENGKAVGSKQAPKGMSQPTVEVIRKEVDAYIKRIK